MAQVDFMNYFSILLWFFILFVIFYYINYSNILPLIYTSLNTRFYVFNWYVCYVNSNISTYINNNNNSSRLRRNTFMGLSSLLNVYSDAI